MEGRLSREYDDQPWALNAECVKQKIPTKAFYPDAAVSPEVRAACYSCDVRSDCLDQAVKFREWGYWGGASEKARKAIRRRMRKNGISIPHGEIGSPH